MFPNPLLNSAVCLLVLPVVTFGLITVFSESAVRIFRINKDLEFLHNRTLLLMITFQASVVMLPSPGALEVEAQDGLTHSTGVLCSGVLCGTVLLGLLVVCFGNGLVVVLLNSLSIMSTFLKDKISPITLLPNDSKLIGIKCLF